MRTEGFSCSLDVLGARDKYSAIFFYKKIYTLFFSSFIVSQFSVITTWILIRNWIHLKWWIQICTCNTGKNHYRYGTNLKKEELTDFISGQKLLLGMLQKNVRQVEGGNESCKIQIAEIATMQIASAS
jgi:hypothetical protein